MKNRIITSLTLVGALTTSLVGISGKASATTVCTNNLMMSTPFTTVQNCIDTYTAAYPTGFPPLLDTTNFPNLPAPIAPGVNNGVNLLPSIPTFNPVVATNGLLDSVELDVSGRLTQTYKVNNAVTDPISNQPNTKNTTVTGGPQSGSVALYLAQLGNNSIFTVQNPGTPSVVAASSQTLPFTVTPGGTAFAQNYDSGIVNSVINVGAANINNFRFDPITNNIQFLKATAIGQDTTSYGVTGGVPLITNQSQGGVALTVKYGYTVRIPGPNETVPEPSAVIGLLAFAGLGLKRLAKNNQK